MKNRNLIVLALTGIAGAAGADVVSGTITADNHYAIYAKGVESLVYIGGNEIGPGGAPGTYNWSIAEEWTFETRGVFYIAAWSDDAVAQGVLADFDMNQSPLLSGDPRWEVYATGINRGDGDLHPLAAEVSGHVDFATDNSLWEAPFVGNENGDAPWGTIAGISGEAQWMWADSMGDSDPLHGGSGAGEMLIFRIAVPSPASAGLLGLAGLTAIRRRR